MSTLSPQPSKESSSPPSITEQFSILAASARNSNAVHDVIRQVWRANAEGHLSDEEAQQLAEAAGARRATLATRTAFTRPPGPRLRPPRHCRSPDQEKSLRRARTWAAGRHVPATLAQHFPTKELAALAFVCERMRGEQTCTSYIDRIAAESGGSRSTVKRMFREAQRLGIIDVRERRIPGRKNESNVVRPLALELIAWLHWQPIGSQQRTTTKTPLKTMVKTAQAATPKPPAIVLQKPWNELTNQERADATRRMISELVA